MNPKQALLSFIKVFIVASLCISIPSAVKAQDNEWTLLSARLSAVKATWTSPPAEIVNKKFTTGMLLGNGDIGVVAGDKTDQQKFYFGKSDFWGASVKNPDAEADPIWQGSILSLGGLTISAGISSPNPDPIYNMEQDILHAEVRTRMQLGNAIVNMTSWTADEDAGSANNFFITELTTDKNVTINVDLWVPSTYKAGGKILDCSGIYPFSTGVDKDMLWAARENAGDPSGFANGDHIGDYKAVEGMALSILGSSFQHTYTGEGNVSADIALRSGRKVYLIMSFASDKWTGSIKNTKPSVVRDLAISNASSLTTAKINALKAGHQEWWKKYWLRSYIDLTDTTLEKFYFGSLYMAGSAMRSGNFPPSLFGNWMTTDLATWGGRYFLNYNEQAALYGVYSSNRPELAMPYIGLILHEMPWQRNKTHAAGFDGVCHQRSLTPDHLVSPAPDSLPIASVKNIKKLPADQKSNGVFAAIPLIWYYEYTMDPHYLQDTLYPYLKELDRFYRSYITMDHKPYSIEHSSAHEGSDDVNPNLDIGFIRKLYNVLINAAGTLGSDADMIPVWQDILDNLSDYPTIIRNGQLVYVEAAVMKESTAPEKLFHPGDQPVNLEGAVFPGENIYVGGDTSRLRIALQSLDQLGGWCINKGGSEHNGFPKHWPVAARIGWPAEDLYNRLVEAIRFHWRESNLTAFQGGGGIETAGAIEGINSMLMQSEGQVIKLFPVWPLTKDASFTRLRAKGAFLISSNLKKGIVSYVEICSEAGLPVSLKNPWQGEKVQLWRNGKKAEILAGDSLRFPTASNEVIRLIAYIHQ
jgi:glycosyl hydrolase family 95